VRWHHFLRGRATSSPPQFGQTPLMAEVHDSQNVHSNEQTNARPFAGVAARHFSHSTRISSDITTSVLARRRLRHPRLRHQRHHLLGKTLHLLGLRAALEQQHVDTHRLEFAHTFGHLLRRADEPRA
jgi:hypothetical protein